MHQSKTIIDALASEIKSKIVGLEFSFAYSISKEEMVMVFSNNHNTFVLRIITRWRNLLLFTSDLLPTKESNARILFESLNKLVVSDVFICEGDRSFLVAFGQKKLLFKCYGPLTNVLFFNEDNLVEMFREDIKNDEAISINNFHLQPIIEAKQTDYCIVKNDEKGYRLTTQLDNNLHPIITSTSIIETYNEFSRLLDSYHRFVSAKDGLISSIEAKLKKRNQLLEKVANAIKSIELARSPDEIGHLIMANLHLIKPRDKRIELLDFYTNKPIAIKLKATLNAQENATYYYKKQKNRTKEIEELLLRSNQAKAEIEALKIDWEKITNANSLKDLKPYLKEKVAEVENKIPFYIFDKNGFDIWVGKNATNNDLLTTKYAHKNDIWLHAKGVSGSHVIIRNNNNKLVPSDVIERAAQLAAYYSKAKGSGWVPVAYASKKFVRKPRGAEPGQVVIEKESTLIVQPIL